MNYIQENKISMYYDVRTYFVNHLSTFTPAVPALTGVINSFNATLDQLGLYEQQATESNDGYAAQKQTNRTDMSGKVMQAAYALNALAMINADEQLGAKVYTTKSRLDSLRDVEVLYWCENLASLATTNAAAIVPMGITAAKLAAMNVAITKFKATLQTPAEQRSDSAAAGRQVDAKMQEIDMILNIVDALIETQRMDQHFLYDKYMTVRKIDDNAAGNTNPDAKATIDAGKTVTLYNTPYNASRQFRINNKGNEVIRWGLSTMPDSPTDQQFEVQPKSESTRICAKLALDGDYLLVTNTGSTSVDVALYVVE